MAEKARARSGDRRRWCPRSRWRRGAGARRWGPRAGGKDLADVVDDRFVPAVGGRGVDADAKLRVVPERIAQLVRHSTHQPARDRHDHAGLLGGGDE